MGWRDWFRSAPAATPTAPSPVVVERRTGSRTTAGRLAMPELPIWQQFTRVGGGLTPVQVSAIIREADTGRMSSLMDLGNEIRQKDAHLQSVLATSEEAIAGLEWELEDPDDSKLKERKAAEFCDAMLRQNRSFARFIAHHAGARFYGYAVSEKLWGRVGDMLVPIEFVPRAHRRFSFDPDSGRLMWWDSSGGVSYPGVDFRAEWPDKFVVSQPRVNGDVPCREGLIRVLMWAALFRNWTLGDWLKLGEIAWKPWRWAKYSKENSGDDEVAALIGTLEGMASSTVAAFPDSTEVVIEWPKGSPASSSSHRELFTTIAAEMSKAVLGQTLTTETTGVGSYSLGKVHENVRKDLRESLAKAIADDITRDVIEPMTRLNWGPGVRASRFRFITEDAADLVSFSTGIKTLVDAGLRIPAVWARDQAGIPEPEEDDELVQAAKPEPAPVADDPQKPAPAAGDATDDGSDPDEDEPPMAAE